LPNSKTNRVVERAGKRQRDSRSATQVCQMRVKTQNTIV
jgi:hypothetical protein